MRDALAERLLAKVMGWRPEDIAEERPDVQAMASYKYDEYRQFSPGMRYAESLALWLSQFRSPEERAAAYRFVKSRLIFCSSAELYHLVSISYPDHIRPFLLRAVAADMGVNEYHVARVANSTQFKVRQRQTLFLGLSDGARIDAFRRYNQGSLSHEQIWQTYEISDERARELIEELRKDISHLIGKEVPPEMARFKTIVLLDDFSGSGISYLRKERDEAFKGKIHKFFEALKDGASDVGQLVDKQRTDVLVVLYMATEQALRRLETVCKELWEPLGVSSHVTAVWSLDADVSLKRGCTGKVHDLVDQYYDPTIHDEHMAKGGTTDSKYGFADCGLPLVLSHNTPNNSIALLWSYEGREFRGLFPRVQRHRSSDEGTA